MDSSRSELQLTVGAPQQPASTRSGAKRLVVFADGTGNAYSTQESNVWRIYRALDLQQPDQIALYCKGVGTSGFAPFARLDAATGIGVPSNVRKLYEFLCWNWREGDEIYMFGFSRGAFTIRTLIGLISHEGLAPAEIDRKTVSNADMSRNVMSAWRSYRSKTAHWSRTLPTIWVARAIRDAIVGLYRTALRLPQYSVARKELDTNQAERKAPRVKFVGLFDTVEAYGVPMEEFRRAIDLALWPISFRNQKMSSLVQTARHALSLDDERLTFHPIRVDQSEPDRRTANPEWIQEVWFSGVHSDVGGGYPDDALTYVPLTWVAQEAERHGLRFEAGAIATFAASASSLGPTHDSRKGLGAFYRYAPRKISDDAKSGGTPIVHYSVAEKMVFGDENYAPMTLSNQARVLMPDGNVVSIAEVQAQQEQAAGAPQPASNGACHSSTDPATRAVAMLNVPDDRLVARAQDLIWWRRVTYFGLLVSTGVVAALPWCGELLVGLIRSFGAMLAGLVGQGESYWRFIESYDDSSQGLGLNLRSIFRTIGDYLPSFLKPWMSFAERNTFATLIALVVFLAFYQSNSILKNRIRDCARQAWFTTRRVVPVHSGRGSRGTIAGLVRNSGVSSKLYNLATKYLLPVAGVVLIVCGALVAASRTTVTYRSGSGNSTAGNAICDKHTEKLKSISAGAVEEADGFTADRLCWPSGLQVEKGRSYTLWISSDGPWRDGAVSVPLAGFKAYASADLLGLLFRRWFDAGWFQPIGRIGAGGDAEWPLVAADGEVPQPLEAAANPVCSEATGASKACCSSQPLSDVAETRNGPRQEPGRQVFVTRFTAEATGELFLYVNDAVAAIPFGPSLARAYDNNCGRARITIMRDSFAVPAATKSAAPASL